MKLKSKKLKNGLLLIAVTTIIAAPLYSYAIDYTATGDSSSSSIDYTAGGGNTRNNKTYSSGGGLKKVIELPQEDSAEPQNPAQDLSQPETDTQNAALSAPATNQTYVEDETEICTDEDRAILEETDKKTLEYSKHAEAAYTLALAMNNKSETSLNAGDVTDFRDSVENNKVLSLGPDFSDNIKLYQKCNQSPPLTAFAPAPIQIMNILGLDSF